MVPKPEHLKHLESMQKDGNDAFIQTCDESSEFVLCIVKYIVFITP